MAKFNVEWSERVWYATEVEADTIEEAKERFYSGEIGYIEQIDNAIEEITNVEEV